MGTPKYAEVARRLRSVIEEDGLVPGDRLPAERDLAHRLGVSRTSIREALVVLRTAGIVEPRRGDGVYLRRDLTDLSPELTVTLFESQRQLPAIMEVREALETHVARLAARRRSSDDLDVIRAACEELAAAINGEGDASHADERFHAGIAKAADNPLLEDLMRQMAEPIARTRAASLARPGRAPRSLAGHLRIVAAIEARDEQGAAAAMREHLMLVADVAHDQGLDDGIG
ncbi:MAG TPA: FadR/GntR family transcriptional regulator [Solirubrobacteraceae bacterium]|jgi:GntR family transcriptional repressor for pyruvate dehydrogenase complex|nr:FadR/GntR family transcriptional regulator [Solirubrobacteraceae bacterium]